MGRPTYRWGYQAPKWRLDRTIFLRACVATEYACPICRDTERNCRESELIARRTPRPTRLAPPQQRLARLSRLLLRSSPQISEQEDAVTVAIEWVRRIQTTDSYSALFFFNNPTFCSNPIHRPTLLDQTSCASWRVRRSPGRKTASKLSGTTERDN
jgi:hypothetical protein